jgi:hypothetical protein
MAFDLGVAATLLFDSLVDKLEEQGIDIPEVAYIAPGNEVVWDCEQLTLHLTRIIGGYPGTDSPVPQPHALLMNSAEFFATIVRCIPVVGDNGQLPDQADVVAGAQGLMRDARAIRRAFEMIDQEHLVVPRNVPSSIGQVVSQGPQGAYAGVSGSYAFQMVDDKWAGAPASLARKANGS